KKKKKKKRIQYIPTDLTIEILSRLPEKSIARFSFVSKLWLSITTDPFFPRPRLVLCFQNYYDLYVSSIPQHTQNSNRSYSSSLSIDYHHSMKLPVDFIHYPSTESVHGVICFELKKPIVWNPSTRKFITLPTIPRPCKDWRKITLLLGYDPVESQESWRTIKVNHKHHSGMHAYGRCIEDRSFKLTGFTHAGEFIYVPKRVSRSFNILLCDPVRNSWRRFEFKGLANEVSVHNGVEEDDDDDDDDDDDEYRPYELDAFPNHIDSQMSL
ncbi:unnamed protein product, partial [Brassica oleracea var. botrytis]